MFGNSKICKINDGNFQGIAGYICLAFSELCTYLLQLWVVWHFLVWIAEFEAAPREIEKGCQYWLEIISANRCIFS